MIDFKRLAKIIVFIGTIIGSCSVMGSEGDTITIDRGDVAWMLIATVLVLFMNLPGLALFYGGMVRSKNVLSLLMQCLVIAAMVTILWVCYGYSLVFSGSGWFIGGLDKILLMGVSVDSISGSIPEFLFIIFQMSFAIITLALIVGSCAERVRFSGLLCFVVLWFSFVYLPVCHWVWGEGGWLVDKGIIDFAGGTVVHINAGVAGLVVALLIGRRHGFPQTPMMPHNLSFTLIGASVLWIGWFGFNAGSAVAADATAAYVMLNTQLGAAAALLGWMFSEWIRHGKPSVLGAASGVIAGLVAITPACAAVGPIGALLIGFIAGVMCFYASTSLKKKLGYDDSLDVFGVHAIGGIVGAMLVGIFCLPVFGGHGFGAGITNATIQIKIQAMGVLATCFYSGILSAILFKVVDFFVGMRVSTEDEFDGLDVSSHNERSYNF